LPSGKRSALRAITTPRRPGPHRRLPAPPVSRAARLDTAVRPRPRFPPLLLPSGVCPT
jgi:hypothetical protein